MKLNTDFRDFYDMAFDRESDRVFERISSDRSMTKLDQFTLLRDLGLMVPIYALGKDLIENTPLMEDDIIVVYTDDRAHCGDGKKLTSIAAMTSYDQECLCAQWINTTGLFDEAQSYRLLQIGRRSWWLRYQGKGGWMSNNCAETDIFIEGECNGYRSPLLDKYPMYAIDFVIPVNTRIPGTIQDVVNTGRAIDFNTAPDLRWTGMNEILQPIDVYDLISEFAEKISEP